MDLMEVEEDERSFQAADLYFLYFSPHNHVPSR